MIRRYIIWRNNHAYDERLRRIVAKANVASCGPRLIKRCSRPHSVKSEAKKHGRDHNQGDGTQIFYKDWGTGQPIVFSHGWPLSADDWDAQMLFFLHHGYRVIAHDRRGHGRSAQVSEGNDMGNYADDLAELTAHLELHDAIHVGHSAAGGEVARYISRHGESRVAKRYCSAR
jgi:alpha-beta hydrolase superfamily lysophospholipase